MVRAMFVAVVITGQIAGGRSLYWLKGVKLLAVYPILGLASFLTPQT